jgi:potassium channel subfamily K protein
MPSIFTGYGHSTPKTVGGKIFCMFYALAGIPLTIVMFQSIGERLNTFATFILKNIKKCFKFKNTDVSQTTLIFVCMNMSSMVLAGGALAFAHREGWPYIDAFYYCFITLTTIGFGDFVALQKKGVLQDHHEYVAFSIVFILFGLTVISAAMNLMVLRFLTMNTEDERKAELEAAEAARTAVRLEGDIITANGSIMSGQQERPEFHRDSDLNSVCSCTCYNFRMPGKRRYTVTHSPGKIAHLLPMQPLKSTDIKNEEGISLAEDTNTLLQYQLMRQQRASI